MTSVTNWQSELDKLPMLQENSPDKPAGVTELNSVKILEMSEFVPTLDTIYVKKPKKSTGVNPYWDSEVWYIFDPVGKKSCRLRLHGNTVAVSGIRYKYKYPGPSAEDLAKPGARFPIKGFQIPLRLQKDSTPTKEEQEQITKLDLAKNIIKVHFFRWKAALGRDSIDWSDISTFKNADKFLKYKIDEKGVRVENRGPTCTMKLYTKEKSGKVKDSDGMLYPEDWIITSPLYARSADGKRYQMQQPEIRQLIPNEVVSEDPDGDDSKFLFDLEPIMYISKVRWAADKCALVGHITQAMVSDKRTLAEPVFSGFGDVEVTSVNDFTNAGAVSPKKVTAAADPDATSEEGAKEEGEDEGEEEEEEEGDETPAPEAAPAPRKPGLVSDVEKLSIATPAPEVAPARTRRAPPKK